MAENENFVELESKIAYIENFLNELNTVVVQQNQMIKKLISEIDALNEQLISDKQPPLNEKPPHY